jgi:precorrin-4 methylase
MNAVAVVQRVLAVAAAVRVDLTADSFSIHIVIPRRDPS